MAVDLTISPDGPGVLGVSGPAGEGAGVCGTVGATGPGVASTGGAVLLPFLLMNGIGAGAGLGFGFAGAGAGAGDGEAPLDSLSFGLVVFGIAPVSFFSPLVLLLFTWEVKYPLVFKDTGTMPGSASPASFLMIMTPLRSCVALGPAGAAAEPAEPEVLAARAGVDASGGWIVGVVGV